MSRIFISHSSANNAEALALVEWLKLQGWDDTFLDLDPMRGLKAGSRWQDALKRAAERCELIVCLISPEWATSRWCLAEFLLAKQMNKNVLGVVVASVPFDELPPELTGEFQVADLTSGPQTFSTQVTVPPDFREVQVAFSPIGLEALRVGIRESGLNPKYFPWPPLGDLQRPPYRGLKPLEADDAGIFFGRDGQIVEALDRLRGLREGPPPRCMVILGASGAGKSSFLRAGLLPRVTRDKSRYVVLPVIRPLRAAINGESGLVASLESAFAPRGIPRTRADLRQAVARGGSTVSALLHQFALHLAPISQPGMISVPVAPPTVVIPIDQAEELFLTEGIDEDERIGEQKHFLEILRTLLLSDTPACVAIFTIRSDNYEKLQLAKALDGIRQVTFSLPPMALGAYADVIRGPAQRMSQAARKLEIDDRLVDRLLEDMQSGQGKDALPLLGFTLERLYLEFGTDGDLRLDEYENLGALGGSIEAAVSKAFEAADADANIPRDQQTRLKLLRSGLIPWLASIDPDTGVPRRRVACLNEVPAESRPLLDLLVRQRLLLIDVSAETGEKTIEPAHEALLRNWSRLLGWLREDTGLLSELVGIEHATRAWERNGRSGAWLTHTGNRLRVAEAILDRPDLGASLKQSHEEYILACRSAERSNTAKLRRTRMLFATLALVICAIGIGWWKQQALQEWWFWVTTARPYMYSHVRPFVLTAERERSLQPGSSFSECRKTCPEMVVVRAGEYDMGSSPEEIRKLKAEYPVGRKTENADARGGLPQVATNAGAKDAKPPVATPAHWADAEGPQRRVRIEKVAISKYEVTFDEWEACVSMRACPAVANSGRGTGSQPVIDVSSFEARQYAAWLTNATGKTYRLLTEAEWEYAARAGETRRYSWGDEIGVGNANCDGCGSQWDAQRPAPVGSFLPNGFGLHDMYGNVREWVEDVWHPSYAGSPPVDGSAWLDGGDNALRVLRGGGWFVRAEFSRSANRAKQSAEGRFPFIGFRVARTLDK